MDQPSSQPSKDLTLDESIQQVMQNLPAPIRTYLASGKYSQVAKSLMGKYALRIDQAGVLERELTLLLMGIEDPSEFEAALKNEAQIPEESVKGIITEVNTQIFVPLRGEMRAATQGEKGSPSAPKAPLPEPRAFAPLPPRPTIGGTPEMRRVNVLAPDYGAPVPSVFMSAPTPTKSGQAPLPPKAALPPAPPARTVPPPANLPGLVNAPAFSAIPAPRPATPAPAPRATPAPPSAPRPLPPSASTSPGPAAAPLPPKPSVPEPLAPKAYEKDPYREPIE